MNTFLIVGIGWLLSLVIHIAVFLYVGYYFTKYNRRVIVDRNIILEFLILTICGYLGIIGIILFYYDDFIYIHECNKIYKNFKYKRPFLKK